MKYLWTCNHCNVYEETEQSIKEDVRPPLKCVFCGETGHERVWEAPAIRTRQSRTFLDGTDRKGFKDLKEIAKLELQKAAANSETEKTGLGKAIREMKTIK